MNLAAIRRNAAALAEHAGVPILPMVKADAYGLGAVEVARALESLEPWGFGVATVAEGMELRDAGIARPVLVLTPTLVEELESMSAARLTPALATADAIGEWKMYGLPYHLSVDTGMSRAGASWREVEALGEAIANCPPQGVFTHFHSAQLADQSMAAQEARFDEAIRGLPLLPAMLHTEASAAIVRNGGSRWNIVRPGIFLYGVSTTADAGIEPEPVVGMHGRVVETRCLQPGDTVSYDATFTAASLTRVATVSAGYADGYPRSLSNAGEAIVRGRRVKVVGRVTMDMVMIDVTGTECEVGDVATLVGRGDPGGDVLTLAAVAERAAMSPYELLTGFRSRLERTYIDE